MELDGTMDYLSPQPQQGPTLEQILGSLGRQTVRIEQLEADNLRLRAQLAAQKAHFQDASSTRNATPTPIIEQSTSTHTPNRDPPEQLHDLVRAHAELKAKYDALKSQHDDVLEKYKLAKERVKDWKVYLGSKQLVPTKKYVAKAACVQIPADDTEVGGGSSDTRPTPRAEGTNTTMKSESVKNVPSSPPPLTLPPNQTTSQSALPSLSTMRHSPSVITSSQTTVDDGIEGEGEVSHVSALPALSNDAPVVVSARILKRKIGSRGATASPSRRIKREPHSPGHPVEICSWKRDHPGGTPERGIYPETSDLDALGEPFLTPRRSKVVNALRQRATSEEVNKKAPQLRRETSSLSDGHVDQRIHDAADDGEGLDPSLLVAKHPARIDAELKRGAEISARRGLQQPLGDALRPISGNIPRAQPLQRKNVDIKPRKPRRTGHKDKVLLISEDGEDISSQRTAGLPTQNDRAATTQSEAIRQRLDILLNEPSPGQTTPVQLPALHERLPRQRPHSHLATPISIVKKSSPVKKVPAPKAPLPVKVASNSKAEINQITSEQRMYTPEGSPLPIQPKDEPLRIRPVDALELSDFRINPNYMGTTFAFADPVRGKEQRNRLPVCNQAGCTCESLRTAIKMGGTALSGKTDAGALQAYLGEEWRHLIGTYDAEQRQEIVIQAHAHCFANQHGKHRQAFARRSTPPGYWRTEFPSTQEQREDHAIADERERKAVEERYREAMRTGGRWKFRDE